LDIDGACGWFDARVVFLHEMLLACALTGVVLAGTYTLLDQGLRAYTVGAARAEGQQAARAALVRMSAEIRYAGRGARRTGPAIAVADPSRLVIASDLDDDGTTDDRGELITWHLDGSILRRNAGGGAQPIANGVRALELRYFDAAGRATALPGEVHAVEVSLLVGPDGLESILARGTATRLTTRVRIRNR
jgi:type II secretory pathway component PulJ